VKEDIVRIKADTDVCVGSGQCVLTEPAVFDQGDDGIVVLLTDQPGGDAAKRARDAVNLCPSQALSIVED
jgi:ferredoxin